MARESQIQIHRTEAAGATPSGLTSGELAVNLKDQKLFVGLSSGGYLTFNSAASSPYYTVNGQDGIVVFSDVAGTENTYTVTLNPDITGHTLNITGNAIFSGYDSGVTFNGRVSIGNGSGAWGLYKNPDQYNLTPNAVLGTMDFTKTIAASIDYTNRIGGKIAELVGANAYKDGSLTVLDIDSITGAGLFLAKAYDSDGQGELIGQYLGQVGGVPPLWYKNAPGDTPQTPTNSGNSRALLVENINANFQALGLVNNQISTPFRTLIQYGTWIDNIQSPSGLGGAPAASGTYDPSFDKYVRTGYLLRGGTGTSGGATGTYVWSQWKNLVETTDDLGKYGVSTVNGGTGDISITGAGNDAAVCVRSTVAGTHLIDARIATASLTGVASFHPGHFTVTNGKVVASFSGGVTFSGTVSGAVKSFNGNDGVVTITGAGQAIKVTSTVAGTHLIDARIATASLTGVASFPSSFFTVSATGAVNLASAYQVTGHTVVSAGAASSQVATTVGNTTTIDNRMASLTVTGVASFDQRHFALGVSGHVSLTGTYQDTVVAGNSISVSRSNNQATITNMGVTGIGFGNDTGLTGKINLTGSAITVSGNLITFTSGSGGVPSVNGNATAITITGAGNDAAIVVRSAVAGTHRIDARIATTSLTGVASFYPGHFTVSNGNVVASFSGGVTFSGTVSGAVKSFNGNGGVVTITGAGQGNGQAIKVTSTVAGTHLIDARLASYSLTGVAYFDVDEFNVDADGYVHIKNPGTPTACLQCSDYNSDESGCEACSNCRWFPAAVGQFGTPSHCDPVGAQILAGSGLGITGISGGSGSALYFDPANLTAYTSNYSNKKTNFVLIFDGNETGLVKAKRATLENFFSENAGLVTSATTGQLTNAVKKVPGFGNNTIELGVVLGNVAAGQEGLVKGASAFAYIETNTVRSFNGLTGAVTAVASVNGCTAAVVITGSASEIEVLNTCPNIVIGLPDNVTISNLNVLSGATFGGNISAKNVVTSFNGLTGAVSFIVPMASLTVTGVASFDQRHFAIGASGHVSLTGSYQVTGNTVVSGGASQLVSVSGNIATIDNRIATASVTGVASFGNEFVVVSGAVGLTSNYVKSINGATGAITNVAKTNVSNDFTSSQQFSDLTVTGFSEGSTVILNSPNIEMGDVYQVGDSVRLIIDNDTVGIYAYGSIYQYGVGGIASDSNLYAPNVNATQFFTFPNGQTATSIVTTVNGATGAITNVAKTDVNNEFTSAQTFNSNVLFSDGIVTVYDSAVERSIILNASTDRIRFYDDGYGNSLDLYAGGNYNNQVIAFPQSNTTLAGLAVTQTFSGKNTFNALTYFAFGISAAGGITFSGTLKGATASFNSLTVSQNTTLGSTASNTTTIYGAKIVNESIYSNGTLRNVGINFANGQVQTLTGIGTGATGTTAIYFTGAPATGAGNVTLLVTNGGSMTGNTTTWEGRIKWPGGVKPTLSTTGIDVVSFVTPDAGTTIYGFLGGLNFS